MFRAFKGSPQKTGVVVLISIALLCVVSSLWPLFLAAILGLIITAVVLAFQSPEEKPEPKLVKVTETARETTERDVLREAFSLIQKGISKDIENSFPGAIWTWEAPDSLERIAKGLPVSILLSRANGYRRAYVRVSNLFYTGLDYITVQAVLSSGVIPRVEANPPEVIVLEPGEAQIPEAFKENESVDYSLLAYQWCEANRNSLDGWLSSSRDEGAEIYSICADDLPCKESWACICEYLGDMHYEAEIVCDSISISRPYSFVEGA